MQAWKRLIAIIKQDFMLTKRVFVVFCICYSLASVIYYIGVNILEKLILSEPLFFIPFIIFVCLYSVVMFCIQYFFQKQYFKKIGIPANINKLSTVLFKSIQIYVVQFLLFMAIVFVVMLLCMIPFLVSKAQADVAKTYIYIITFCIVIIGIVWFYRLYFVNYIIVYSRINMKTKIIIQESKYLFRKNISILLTFLSITILVMIPQIIDSFTNKNQFQINYVSSFIFVIIGILNAYSLVVLTRNEIINHKYFFLLEPKN